MSPAASAAIATGFLKDMIAAGHISQEMNYLACDPKKLMRARRVAMESSRECDKSRLKDSEVLGVYFDGRKDLTRVIVHDSNGNLHPRLIKEEHISVTVEPSGAYLGHVSPESPEYPDKPAQKVAEAVFDLLNEKGIADKCVVLGGDSTASNTGWKGGSISHLEKLLGHKCHWTICMIHTNELPLRRLIRDIDGPTASDTNFTGPIGKMLNNVTEMEVNTDFQVLDKEEPLIKLPENVIKNMSTDQRLAYQLCQSVKTGVISQNLQNVQFGPMNHARWLTTAMRIVYLWTRNHGLSGGILENLEVLVRFCLASYFKLFFEIKAKDNLEEGPHHIVSQLRVLKNFPAKIRDIVTPIIRLGAWHAHPENVLLSLLASEEKESREFAVEQTLKIRGTDDHGNMKVRPRKTPKLNMSATTVKDLIYWGECEVQEPVFTCNLTQEELMMLVENSLIIPSLKIHTQSTERAVHQVTEAAKHVVGMQARDGFIRARSQHREVMPVFTTKKDIMCLFK